MEIFFDEKTQAYLRYFDFPGMDPPILFLAGLGLAATAVFPRTVVEPAYPNRRSIMVDYFGCGFSDRPQEFSYRIEAHAEVLWGFVEHLGLTDTILFGHSMGGAVAIELASIRPDLVSRLILAEANLFAGGGMWSKQIAEQTERDFLNTGFDSLIQNLANAAQNGFHTAAILKGIWQIASPLALYRGSVSLVEGTEPVMWEKLIQLSMPKTFIFGSRSLAEYEEDRNLKQRLEAQGIHVAIVPDAGHGMMAENPEGVATIIAGLLSR